MKCSYKGKFNIPHSKKRRLMGSKKDEALNQIINNKISPSVYVRNEANKIMKEGMRVIYIIISNITI